jgi:hypothetical protein
VGASIGGIAGPQIGKTLAGTAVRSNIGAGMQTFAEFLAKAKTTPAGEFVIPKSVILELFGE